MLKLSLLSITEEKAATIQSTNHDNLEEIVNRSDNIHAGESDNKSMSDKQTTAKPVADTPKMADNSEEEVHTAEVEKVTESVAVPLSTSKPAVEQHGSAAVNGHDSHQSSGKKTPSTAPTPPAVVTQHQHPSTELTPPMHEPTTPHTVTHNHKPLPHKEGGGKPPTGVSSNDHIDSYP